MTAVIPATREQLRLHRIALYRLFKYEQQTMRRLQRAQSKRVAPQAMWMADIKQEIERVEKLAKELGW